MNNESNNSAQSSAQSFSKTVLAQSVAAAVAVIAGGPLSAADEDPVLEEIIVTARQHAETAYKMCRCSLRL